MRRETEGVEAGRRTAQESLTRAQRRAGADPARQRRARVGAADGAHGSREPRQECAGVRTGAGAKRGSAGVARGARGQPRRSSATRRAWCSSRPTDRSASRAPSRTTRRRQPLRARGRSLPWRAAAARHRRTSRPGGSRPGARPRAGCRPLRLRRHRSGSNGHHPREAIRMPGTSADLRCAARCRTARGHDPEGGSGGVHRRDVRVGGGDGATDTRRRSRRSKATSCGARIWCRGGAKVESRGILATKREIRELRERIASRSRGARPPRRRDASASRWRSRRRRAQLRRSPTSSTARKWRSWPFRRRSTTRVEEAERLTRKADVIALERRQAEEERASIDARYAEAEASIVRLFDEQRRAEAGLSEAQGRLMAARETVDALSARRRGGTCLSRGDDRARVGACCRSRPARGGGAATSTAASLPALSELEQVRARREGARAGDRRGRRTLDEDIRAPRGAARGRTRRPTRLRRMCAEPRRWTGCSHS